LDRRLITGLLFFLLIVASSSMAQTGHEVLSLEIKFVQIPEQTGIKPQTVICDTFNLVRAEEISGVFGNLSLDMTYNGIRENLVSFEFTRISFPPGGITKFRKVKMPFGTPYIEDSVLTKGNHFYRALYTPLDTSREEIVCEYDHRKENDFYSDPSSDFDIYFIPNSLADFHWNQIRDFMENEMDKFYKVFNFTQPGKISFFPYPCEVPYYLRCNDYGFGLHPAKNCIYMEYSHLSSDLPIYAAALTKLYRYWGYAPKLLSEGAAHITDFYLFYCREYKKDIGLYPLEEMLISNDFDNLEDNYRKQIQAASFVSYLLATIHVENFKQLYLQSTDLTLKQDIEEFTGLRLADLEKEWHKYVDTVTYETGWHLYFGQRELGLRNINEAVYLFEAALDKDPEDSTYDSQLFNACYLKGDYKKAEKYARKIYQRRDTPSSYLSLANMLLSGGDVDSARFYYTKALNEGISDDLVHYKLGQIELFNGNLEKAKEQLYWIIDSATSIPFKIDSWMILGQMKKEVNQLDSADLFFTYALNASKNLLSQYPDNSLFNLRAGEAALLMNEPEAARKYLSLAEFVELRAFYLGRTLTALGKLHDLENDRETAKTYYHRVLDIPSAFLDKETARKYLSKPFKL